MRFPFSHKIVVKENRFISKWFESAVTTAHGEIYQKMAPHQKFTFRRTADFQIEPKSDNIMIHICCSLLTLAKHLFVLSWEQVSAVRLKVRKRQSPWPRQASEREGPSGCRRAGSAFKVNPEKLPSLRFWLGKPLQWVQPPTRLQQQQQQ